MQRAEMNKGVQILLERMQSNPEEFTPDWRGEYPPKWRRKLEAIGRRAVHINDKRKNKDVEYYPELPFLKDEEILELWQAMQDLLANQFTEEVMATLLHDASEADYPAELSSSFEQAQSVAQKYKNALAQSTHLYDAVQYLDPYEKQHMMDLMKEYEKAQKGVTLTLNTKRKK